MPKHERPEPEDDADRSFMALIDKHGWAVKFVFDEEAQLPNSHYSVGIFETLGQPELLVVGLAREVGKNVINHYGNRLAASETFTPGQRYGGFLDGFDVMLLETNSNVASEEYTIWADWFYRRRAFPLLQLVWPDKKSGAFPWEEGFRGEIKALQPVLGTLPLRR